MLPKPCKPALDCVSCEVLPTCLRLAVHVEARVSCRAGCDAGPTPTFARLNFCIQMSHNRRKGEMGFNSFSTLETAVCWVHL